MKLHLIYNPNRKGAELRVHKVGCADIKRDITGQWGVKRASSPATSDYVSEFGSQREAAEDFYADFIAENSMTPESALGCTEFLPCTAGLTENGETEMPNAMVKNAHAKPVAPKADAPKPATKVAPKRGGAAKPAASKPATPAKPAAAKPAAKRTAPRKPAVKPASKPASKAPASKPATVRKSRAGAARYAPRGPKGETKQSLTAQILEYVGNSVRVGNLKLAPAYVTKAGGMNVAKIMTKFAADHKAGRTYLVDGKPVSAYVISESGKPVNGTQRVMLDRLFTKYAK